MASLVVDRELRRQLESWQPTPDADADEESDLRLATNDIRLYPNCRDRRHCNWDWMGCFQRPAAQ
jgi:hypothetical protein